MKETKKQLKGEALVSTALKNPNTAVERCHAMYKDMRAGYRTDLWQILAGCFAAAVEFRKGKGNWKKFAADNFWTTTERGRPKDPKDALLPILHFTFGGRRYDRAWKYSRGLKLYVNQKVPPEDVADKLKRDGGIEALCRKATKKSPRHKRRPSDPSAKRLLQVEVSEQRLRKLLKLPSGARINLKAKRLSTPRPCYRALGFKRLRRHPVAAESKKDITNLRW